MSDLSGVFETVRQQLSRPMKEPLEVPQVEGSGESEDGLVTVTVAAGLAKEIRIDARAMRLSNVELADRMVEAVNAAVEAYAAAVVDSYGDQTTDFGRLRSVLDEVQQQTEQSMGRYLGSMEQMLTRAAQQHERYQV